MWQLSADPLLFGAWSIEGLDYVQKQFEVVLLAAPVVDLAELHAESFDSEFDGVVIAVGVEVRQFVHMDIINT